MTNNEKIPAQGGEMPPVERAAHTGSRGASTLPAVASADNAAQERNTNAAALDRDIAHLIDCSEGGIARVPRETLVRLRALLTAPRAGLPRHVLASLECTAAWLEIGNDPQDAARELRACLAKIDAAPAAPAADPLRRRVERLLVELHAEGRMSEGQCAKMLDIPRIDWRELAEFLAPDAQAVAADWSPEDEPSEIEQVIACLGDDAAQLRDANPDDEMADNMESAARLLAERAAFDAWLADEFPDVAAAMKNEFTNPDVTESVDMAQAAWDRASLGAAPAEARKPFQARVQPWMLQCFGAAIAADRVERNHRFLEEALELVQSLGCTASEAHQLVDYTFGRPIGELAQEVGGVMVTLAALCLANTLDMHAAGETELARISEPAMVLKIRAKQAAKPKHSPLPETPANPGEAVATNLDRHMITVWRNGKWKLWTYGEACLAGRDRDWLINISIPPMVQGAQGGKGGKA
ncbi:hypothetical protein [Burkholderia gladioli]|uniref:hypothetical protein n=1 Tax=Burkholderia gladioli TaxID=28095 RepID=UPI00264B5516|nr:hypothetical protein [Burkholderia gladioli]MDN7724883.1 hypothetical protein [Burkholderia gladioli]